MNGEFNRNLGQSQRMSKRNEFRSALSRLDRRNARNPEDIALLGIPTLDQRQCFRLHDDPAAGARNPVRLGFRRYIHHVGLAATIKMRQRFLHVSDIITKTWYNPGNLWSSRVIIAFHDRYGLSNLPARLLKKLVAALLLCPLAAFAQALPDLGDISDASLSETQERTIGKRIMLDVRGDQAFVEDSELTDYINELGNRLVLANPTNRREFEFFLLRDDSINAFALVGGFVGVHTGLILATQNESELAGVLGHEVSHVLQRHQARMMAGQKGSTVASLAALAVAILAARSGSNSQVPEAAIATASAVGIQSQLDYTREFEREADRSGLTLMERAGFDPRGMVSFFERLQRANRHNDSKAPGYLRTHPLTTERISDMQDRVETMLARKVADSLDYQLAYAKLRAQSGSAGEAVEYFRDLIAGKTVLRSRADVYGLVTALKRNRDYASAEKELLTIRSSGSVNPWIEHLAAELKSEQKKFVEALDIYRNATKAFPDRRALLYGQLETLYEAGQVDAALASATERIRAIQDDPHLYDLQARGYALKGKQLAQHRATAESYYRRGNLVGAIEQLEIAVKANDGDFYERSIAEARLREFKAERAARKPLPGEKPER
jgi:beta-barrel assembly-enhancing protease